MVRKIIIDSLHHLFGLLQCRVGREHGLHDQDSLIFVREIACGHSLKKDSHGHHDKKKKDHVAELLGQELPHHLQIPFSGPQKHAVKPSEERPQKPDSPLGRFMPLGHRLQKRGTEHRRQNQGDHHRQKHGGDNGHGKLPVNHPRGTLEKRHRTKDGRKHQTDADQGRGDLVHGFACRLHGRKTFLAHDPFHVFHHHDGVIHQQADGQHHGEHGQHVDGKTEQPQHGESSQEHHRHGDGRNQRGPHRSHEQIHYQENQQDRLEQSFDYLADGHPDERGGVVGINNLHALAVSKALAPAACRMAMAAEGFPLQ